MSQVANTFWDERVERVGAAVRANPATKKRVRARRLVDAVVMTIILAAAATCVSVYNRARGEFDAATMKHRAAGEKVQDLAIKVEKLERDVKQLRTDSRVIELFARQRFGFVRSGDVVIKVEDKEEPGQSAQSVQSATSQSDGRPNGSVNSAVRVANLTPQTSGVYTDASN